MDWELWGTFSVGDHLRRRAFVADVLLYDRLVIPTPPETDDAEQKRWREMGWKPDRQRQLLSLMPSNHLIQVPWIESHRRNWETRYRDALGPQQPAGERAALRSRMAATAAADVSIAVKARDSFDWEGYKNRGGRPEEVDQLAHFTTRDVLVDWSNAQQDTKIFMGLPRVQVDPVVAYGSYSAFSEDHQVSSTVSEMTPPPSNLLQVFGWEFLVPNDSRRSDDDLLRQAVDIANLPETKQHRQVFHRWRRDHAGQTSNELREEMEQTIEQYKAAVLKLKFATVARHGFAVATAGLGVAAVFNPDLGIPGAFTGLGSYVVTEAMAKEIPERLKVAAMFHDARKRFGWYRWMRR